MDDPEKPDPQKIEGCVSWSGWESGHGPGTPADALRALSAANTTKGENDPGSLQALRRQNIQHFPPVTLDVRRCLPAQNKAPATMV